MITLHPTKPERELSGGMLWGCLRLKPMTDMNGFCEPRFAEVSEALAALLGKDDVGASAAVYLDGEPVVDIWGGYADADRSVRWERDTIVGVNSTTKNMTALCALILADRGELDLSAAVAD